MKNYFLIICLCFFALSCRKDKTVVVDNQTTSSQDNNISENVFADIKKVVEEAATDEGKSAKNVAYSFGACATVSTTPAWTDTVNWPKTMTIDFGTTNCTDSYGINRRGKLIVTVTGRYIDSGTVLTVQPQNYYVNDYLVEGTKTLTNLGRNANNHLTYQVVVTNGKVTFPDGQYTTWNSTRTNEWIEGDTTSWFSNGLAGVCDDVYLITGSASGVNRRGLNYTVTITTPLRKEICCRWLVSGVLKVSPSGLPDRIIDFGNGTCDNKATVTINGNSFEIPMI